MLEHGARQRRTLNLKAGEWVEVRSRDEILATLDERGRLENLPFMPEMLSYCGQKFRVSKRADKTCDPAHVPWSIRRLRSSVHLEGMRCDGSGHGGCQAGCLIFWKAAWLKRADPNVVPSEKLRQSGAIPARTGGLCTLESILAGSRAAGPGQETVYVCQATELRNYTSFMKWWDPRQYVRDVRSGNLATGLACDSREQRTLEVVLATVRVLQSLIITLFNRRQEGRGGARYPFIVGTQQKTPVETLDLQPGELVKVKTKEDIMATLDKQHRNRGLQFNIEMLPYCGGIYRVLRRVHHIIDEKTGKMIDMKYPCIVLEGVICRSDYHRLCPRAIYSYWRENWLERVVSRMPDTEEMKIAQPTR